MADTATETDLKPADRKPKKIVTFRRITLGVPFNVAQDGQVTALVDKLESSNRENKLLVNPGNAVTLTGLLAPFDTVSLLVAGSRGERLESLEKWLRRKSVLEYDPKKSYIRFTFPDFQNVVPDNSKIHLVLSSLTDKNIRPALVAQGVLYSHKKQASDAGKAKTSQELQEEQQVENLRLRALSELVLPAGLGPGMGGVASQKLTTTFVPQSQSVGQSSFSDSAGAGLVGPQDISYRAEQSSSGLEMNISETGGEGAQTVDFQEVLEIAEQPTEAEVTQTLSGVERVTESVESGGAQTTEVQVEPTSQGGGRTTANVSVSGSQTAQRSGSVSGQTSQQVSGTMSSGQRTQVSGLVTQSSQGSVNGSVLGNTQVSGSVQGRPANQSGSAEVGVSANATAQVNGAVEVQANQQVSGNVAVTAEGNIIQKAVAQSTPQRTSLQVPSEVVGVVSGPKGAGAVRSRDPKIQSVSKPGSVFGGTQAVSGGRGGAAKAMAGSGVLVANEKKPSALGGALQSKVSARQNPSGPKIGKGFGNRIDGIASADSRPVTTENLNKQLNDLDVATNQPDFVKDLDKRSKEFEARMRGLKPASTMGSAGGVGLLENQSEDASEGGGGAEEIGNNNIPAGDLSAPVQEGGPALPPSFDSVGQPDEPEEQNSDNAEDTPDAEPGQDLEGVGPPGARSKLGSPQSPAVPKRPKRGISAPKSSSSSAQRPPPLPKTPPAVPAPGAAAGASGMPSANPAQVADAAKSIMSGQRPDNKVILDMMEQIPVLAPYVKPIRLGLKFLREDENEICEAIWPKEDLIFNPQHIQRAKLALIVSRIGFKLLVINFGIFFLSTAVSLGIVVGATLIVGCNTTAGKIAISSAGGGEVCDALASGFTAGLIQGNPTLTNSSAGNNWKTLGAGVCQPAPAGPASAPNLSATCFGENAAQASGIAYAESGGIEDRVSGVDICADGNAVSFGLFQINISAHQVGGLNCPAAFSSRYDGKGSTCRVVNQSLYNQCVAAATNAQTNITTACQISGNGSNWSAWGANRRCGY